MLLNQNHSIKVMLDSLFVPSIIVNNDIVFVVDSSRFDRINNLVLYGMNYMTLPTSRTTYMLMGSRAIVLSFTPENEKYFQYYSDMFSDLRIPYIQDLTLSPFVITVLCVVESDKYNYFVDKIKEDLLDNIVTDQPVPDKWQLMKYAVINKSTEQIFVT